MHKSGKLLLSFAVLVLGLTFNLIAFSDGESISNGYICDPKNPGGEDTRKYYRQQDGLAINIAPSSTFPIVCPVILPFNLAPYEVSVAVVNTGTSTQKFSCALEENDFAGNPVRSVGNSASLPAGESGLLYWSDIVLVSEADYLSVRCILPPKGAVSLVEWF